MKRSANGLMALIVALFLVGGAAYALAPAQVRHLLSGAVATYDASAGIRQAKTPIAQAPSTSLPITPQQLGFAVSDTPAGCQLATVMTGSAAARAGLKVGDLITAVGSSPEQIAVANCSDLETALASQPPGSTYSLQYVRWEGCCVFFESRVAGVATIGANQVVNCPGPIAGSISSSISGNRIPLTIELVGPSGTTPAFSVMLDTGGVRSIFNQAMLHGLGLTPVSTTSIGGAVPGAYTLAYVYELPANDLRVLDQGRYVPLATGTLTVVGIANFNFPLVGPDVLKQGADLVTSGDTFTLTPPCGP